MVQPYLSSERQQQLSDENFEIIDRANIFVRDQNDRIVRWSRGAETMYGYTEAEALGRSSHELLRTQFPEDLRQIMGELERRGQWQGELVHKRKNDGRVVVESVWIVHRDSAGRRNAVLEINTDITARRAAEDKLKQLNYTLEQRVADRTAALLEINAELEAFSYSISHDLRAPLRAMQGFAEALLEDFGRELPQDAREYTERIVAAARRMSVLINDLLEYSRLSKIDVALEDVDLATLVTRVLEGLNDEIVAKHGVVTVAGVLPVVRGNTVVLQKVLQNLIENALKFTAPGVAPCVTIRANDEAGIIRVTVADNGIGIDPEHQRRIFNVFERLHGIESYPGTGIGLALVRRGLERIGSRYGVESSVGTGARFWFELPKA